MPDFLAEAMDRRSSSHFEEVINRGWYQYRSAKLQELVDSVREYVQRRSVDNLSNERAHLAHIVERFNGWRVADPKEFAARLGDEADHFVKELEETCRILGVAFVPYDPRDDNEVTFAVPPATADNLHRGFTDRQRGNQIFYPEIEKPSHYPEDARKRKEWIEKGHEVVELGLTSAEVAVPVAEGAEKLGAVIDIAGGGGAKIAAAAAGLTPAAAGLGAASLAAMAINSAVALRSGYRTHNHLRALKTIWNSVRDQRHTFKCLHIEGESVNYKTAPQNAFDLQVHRIVGDHVLPYVIRQKESKEAKKIGTAVVVGAFPISLWSMGRKIYKWSSGQLGVERYKAAHWLAYHFCVCDCQLAMSIVAALTTEEEMYWLLREGDYEAIAQFLAEKMKST